MNKKFPNYIKYILSNIGFLFVYLFFFRLIFFFFISNFESVSKEEIQTAFSYGIRFDLKLVILSYFPLSLFILSKNYLFFKKKVFRKIAITYHILLYLLLTIIYLIDIGYYNYLFTRLDASSLRFLSNLKISSQLVMETYPVYKGLFALILLFVFIRFISIKLFDKMARKDVTYLSKKMKAVYFISIFLLLSFGVYGSITHYPLRWSEAFFSKNNSVNQFALNPVLNFFDTYNFRNDGVNNELTKAYFPIIADYLGLSKDSISFKREVTFDSIHKQKPNLVIVMLESLGSVALGHEGNVANATKNIDQIISESTYFENFYVHKPGTAATVFSSITGLPDIDTKETASRI
jgi:hypothetical protein